MDVRRPKTVLANLAPSVRPLSVAIVFVCLILGAIFRGYYLLGSGAGIAFGILAAGVLWLFYSAIAEHQNRPILSMVIAATLALGAFAAIAFPSYLSEDLGMFINDHATERETQHQLQQILAGEVNYANLAIECRFRKCIFISVRGTLQTKSDLLELRRQIFENCPKASSRWLFWDVTIAESGTRYDDIDLTLFGDWRTSGTKGEHP